MILPSSSRSIRPLLCRRPVLSRDAGDDDPCVADEYVASDRCLVQDGLDPGGPKSTYRGDFQAHHRGFGVTIGDTWTQIRHPGSPTRGRVRRSRYSAAISAAQRCFARDRDAGGADGRMGRHWHHRCRSGTSYSVLTPTFYFGQGLGQLPDTVGWARPLARNRPGRVSRSRPRHLMSARVPSFRKCWCTARRCNTACPTSNPR